MGNDDSGGDVSLKSKGLKLTFLALVIVTFKALCWRGEIHSMATCRSLSTPVEGGLTMATLKSEVNTSRPKNKDTSTGSHFVTMESVRLPSVLGAVNSYLEYKRFVGRHSCCRSVHNLGQKSIEQICFEAKGKKLPAADSMPLFDRLHTSFRSNETRKHFRFS